uniref:Small-subunit processome Utp21 domain-containing protein n=1 Tax=Trichobilharzia regenti TaxID=157069 RepID=A0AA85JWW6_TRIRE
MSRIFDPYRVLGLCSSDVPFVVKYIPNSEAYYAVVPTGERFNLYKLPRLTLVGTSDPVESPIRSFVSCGNILVAAAGKAIYTFRNSRYLLQKLELHAYNITHLCVLHNTILVSVDEGGFVRAWNTKTWEFSVEVEFSRKSFYITSVLHPQNYKNKVLFGSSQGALQLWNIVSQKLLHWFRGFDASVTCLQQAPAIDVCAVGLADGRIIIHNLKYDVTLMKFAQDCGAITSIGFRSGSHGLQKPSNIDENSCVTLLPSQNNDVYLVSGCETGYINCWELKEDGKSRSVGQARNLHCGSVITIYCIPGGDAASAMVTSGSDNCIKVSYFDRPDGGPRTVYRRVGHSRPPNRVVFWPGSSAGGAMLLSAGKDGALRVFSTFNECSDKSLGCAYAPGAPDCRKATREQRSSWLLPEVVDLAACATRAEAWDNIIAVHGGKRQVTSWNFMKATRGQHCFDAVKFHGFGGEATRLYKKTVATCVYLTNCGNFALIGYSSGDVFKFNMQSGLERGSYGSPSAHQYSIVGVAVNNVNRVTITVGGSEVRFWSFNEHELLEQLDLPSTSSLVRFHADSDILGVALSNASITLIDALHRQVIRTFVNSEVQLCVDMDFSFDGRWLISAHHGDPLIKTWDIVDSKLIDCFRVELPITSISLSKANEFLATTHANCLGIYLWDNRAAYKRLHLQPLPTDYIPCKGQSPVSLPNRVVITRNTGDEIELGMRTDEEEFVDQECTDDPPSEESVEHVYISPAQLDGRLVTLSGIPSSYFTTLLHLDLIRERSNHATKHPMNSEYMNDTPGSADPRNLPFFLPVVETNKGLSWADKDAGHDDGDSGKELSTKQASNAKSNKRRGLLDKDFTHAIEPIPSLSTKLVQAKSDDKFDEISHSLKSVGPNALDLEIRLLIPSDEDEILSIDSSQTMRPHNHLSNSYQKLYAFLRYLINRFQSNRDVDFACICLEIVLQRHNDILFRHDRQYNIDSCDQTIKQYLEMSEDMESFVSSHSTILSLIKQAVKAKEKSQSQLTNRITQSLCLV